VRPRSPVRLLLAALFFIVMCALVLALQWAGAVASRQVKTGRGVPTPVDRWIVIPVEKAL
jgi:hypothetical protein